MKIDNNGISPLTPKNTDPAQRVEKRAASQEAGALGGRDKAVLSENARLLAKARTALDNTADVESERVALLRSQIESGDYTVQVESIARKLVSRFYPKS